MTYVNYVSVKQEKKNKTKQKNLKPGFLNSKGTIHFTAASNVICHYAGIGYIN